MQPKFKDYLHMTYKLRLTAIFTVLLMGLTYVYGSELASTDSPRSIEETTSEQALAPAMADAAIAEINTEVKQTQEQIEKAITDAQALELQLREDGIIATVIHAITNTITEVIAAIAAAITEAINTITASISGGSGAEN